MENRIGQQIAQKRKELGYTQQKLADVLKVSFQAVSKWERGSTTPDIALLPEIARILDTTVDALVGYQAKSKTHYEEKYREEDFYWGLEPNKMCYEVMRLRPPVKPYRVLDIGCGEGKDAVFFARNGYRVTAFDIADAGLEKAVEPWRSGELAGYYHDWLFHQNEEIIFDCNSGGIPHKHCMDILIGEKPGL